MAKKEKKEKTESQSEAKNVKEKLKESKAKKVKKSSLGAFIKCFFISSAVVTALIAIVGFYFYSVVTNGPPMPEINLNEYWGPKDTNIKDTAIRPYRIIFTDSMEEEIRQLFELYRRHIQIPSFENTGWTYGVNSTEFAKVTSSWTFDYDFREQSKFLNKYNHFRTIVQGLDLHYVHVKPETKGNLKVYPLLLLHGWPGNFREFYEAIPRLTNERKGYDFVFEVIIPSLPGFILSEGATRPGMSPVEMAVIMRNLMQRIGFKKYFVQGGDLGSLVGSNLATIFPDEVLGFHTNFPVNLSKYSYWLWFLGSLWPNWVAEGVEDKMYPLTDKAKLYLEESGYLHLQSTKPDTIGIALEDSPIGLSAYIIDRFLVLTDPKNKIRNQGGMDKSFSMEKFFDIVMLYWTTGSITTSMRVFKESWRSGELQQTLAQIPTKVPAWALRFKHEIVQQSDFLLRLKYPNLVGSSSLDAGGHYAAFERPKTFADDVFKAVNTFLKFWKLKA